MRFLLLAVVPVPALAASATCPNGQRGALYLRYSLSLRDVEELLKERGLQVDHTTVLALGAALRSRTGAAAAAAPQADRRVSGTDVRCRPVAPGAPPLDERLALKDPWPSRGACSDMGYTTASTFPTLSSRLSRSVWHSTSGAAGGSYGSETPVKAGSSPVRASRYKPFGSRCSHTARGAFTYTSMNRLARARTLMRASA
jgi:hypothetical protein